MSTLRVTILGSGSSGGVPRTDGSWGACDPNEPKNRRTRCGLMLQQWRGEAGAAEDATMVLIDTATELRQQLAAVAPHHVDAVLYTHDHADQTHGVDDLRAFFMRHRKRIPVYMPAETREILTDRFRYCFESGEGGYPAILDDAGLVQALHPIVIDGPGGPMSVLPLLQDHGICASYGFRVGPVAYCNDVVRLPEESFAALEGVGLLIVDALREAPHATHAHVGLALDWIARVRAKRGVLTNMTVELDYATLKAKLPAEVEPAYDGWSADFTV